MSKDNKLKNKYSGCIGIDLGTTNCVISYISNDDKLVLVRDEDDNILFPSFIHFFEENNKIKYIAGRRAMNIAKENPTDVISSYKVNMGIQDEETGKSPVLKTIKGKPLTAETCSMLMLSYLKKQAEKFIGEEIHSAVITVPAYFTEAQKQATIFSAKNAGLHVLRLVNEPTSATHYYNKELKTDENDKTILAFDLGGGTFDLSLISLERDEDNRPQSNVLDTSGDTRLGGDNIDEALASYMLGKDLEELPLTEKEILIREAEDCKKKLSDAYMENKSVTYKPKNKEFKSVTVKQFLKILEPFIDRCIDLTKDIVSRNKMVDKIDEILLIGGSTRLPLIREKLVEFFNKDKFTMEYFDSYLLAPDYAVSYGAGHIIKNIMESEDIGIEDVVAIPIKIVTSDGLETIISNGQPIPTFVRRNYTNAYDYQDKVIIEIYEGFGNSVKNGTTHLGSIEIPVEPSKKETIPILVSLKVNEDSVMEVTVQVANKRSKLTIHRHFDDNDTNINTILEDMSSIKRKEFKNIKF